MTIREALKAKIIEVFSDEEPDNLGCPTGDCGTCDAGSCEACDPGCQVSACQAGDPCCQTTDVCNWECGDTLPPCSPENCSPSDPSCCPGACDPWFPPNG